MTESDIDARLLALIKRMSAERKREALALAEAVIQKKPAELSSPAPTSG